jgi:uncharacterized phage protein gp47/JayE
MAFPVPGLEQIRTAILADWRNLDPTTPVDADSDNYIRATGIASAICGLYQYASWGVNQFFPDTAELDNLTRFAAARGITAQPPTSATGTIQFTGTPGAAIAIGTIVQVNGLQYQTTAAGVIGAGGQASVAALSLTVGPGGNQSDNTAGTLLAAPAGVDSAAILLQMSGGVEAESAAALLARVLDRLRQPPAGGNRFDYARWTRDVPGVTAAFVYPKRRGLGTVDVALLSNGIPASAALRDAVTAYIVDKMPPQVDFMALSPQPIPVAVSATVVLNAGVLLPAVQAAAQTALAAYFDTLKPGDTAVRSRIQTIIGDLSGVVDYALTAPAANVATTVDAQNVQMPSLGVVTIGL